MFMQSSAFFYLNRENCEVHLCFLKCCYVFVLKNISHIFFFNKDFENLKERERERAYVF